jgi:hypothetical protein
MLKILIIIIGSVVISAILLKVLLPAETYSNWAKASKYRIIILYSFFLIMLVTFLIYIIGTNLNVPRNEVVEKIRNLQKEKIISILIYNGYNLNYKLSDSIIIKNDSLTTKFITKLKDIEMGSPYNNASIWTYDIKILLYDKTLSDIVLKVNKNRESGYYLWILRKTRHMEFNLGCYKCDNLGSFLESNNFFSDDEDILY